MKAIINTLIIGLVLFILFAIVGASYTDFYLGGKEEMLNQAAQINQLCNTNKACPTTLTGWLEEGGTLSKGNMLYIVSEGDQSAAAGKKHQSYKIIYRFFAPDEWFEAEGGVNQPVTAGWKSR